MRAALGLLFILWSTLAIPFHAWAAIQIPQTMDKTDRTEALRIIGLGSSSKILSDPYPLGGYAGFEAGFSVESLPAEDLGRLGAGLEAPQQDVALPKLTIGKGVYNNVDLFLQFTPYTPQDEFSLYGGMVRWGFYQAATLPFSLSALVHATSINVANKMTTHSHGVDLIGGVNVENVALFTGIGAIEATGTFIGGAANTTDTGVQEKEFVSGTHTLIGAKIGFQKAFIALQVDRYTVTVFGAKFGVRF